MFSKYLYNVTKNYTGVIQADSYEVTWSFLQDLQLSWTGSGQSQLKNMKQLNAFVKNF